MVRWILALQLVVFFGSVSAQQFNLVQKNVPLLRLFKEVRKQTGVSVVWNESEFDINRKIDVNYRNAPLMVVMDEVAAKTSSTYTVIGKMIVIKGGPIGKRTDPVPALTASASSLAAPINLEQVDIVSTGYQLIPKERAAGSFVLVDSAQIDRRVSRDLFSRLEGITSGLLFNKNTVSSNSGNLDFSIRGRSTIYANDQPLIVLDNFPYNGDLESINPNDVANVTVLKDAAAASIWGVRAGNGVIVVTTKRGKYKQPLNVSINANVSLAGKPDVFYNPNYLASRDFIEVEKFLFDNGKYNVALADKVNYPVISPTVRILERQRNGELSLSEMEGQLDALRDNDIRREELKYFYRVPVSQQYALSMSGGTEKSNHYFSAGYDKAQTNLVHNENDRLSINSQNSFRPLKNLELRAGIYYVRSAAMVDSTIRSTSEMSFLPYYEFKDANGQRTVFNRDFDATYKSSVVDKGFLNWDYIPLDELGRSPIRNKDNALRLNGGLTYTLFDGLKVDARYQYQRTSGYSRLFNDLESHGARSMINYYAVLTSGQVTSFPIPRGGILNQTTSEELSQNIRLQLGYQKNWQKHGVSAIAGYELSEFDTQANRRMYYGYDPKTEQSIPIDSITTFRLNPSGAAKISTGADLFGVLDRIRSVFANAAYTYGHKYTISGSMRMDGSNYFGIKTNQKNVPLWSAGALWHIDREPFFDLHWMSDLKLRASYGYNGNLDKRITGITTFRKNILGASFTNLPFASVINIGNPELRWEKIGIANFGIDFAIKNQVLTGKIEYYFKRGKDILGDRAFPANTGIKILRGNYAEISGQGFDLALTSQNLRGRFSWQSNLLFSTVSDRVTSYDVVEPVSIYYVGNFNEVPLEGKSIYGIYSYKWAGLDPENGDPRGYLNGEVSKDYSAIIDNTAVSDLEYHGTSRPTVFGSINNVFSYKRFTLGVNIVCKLGYYFRKPSVNYFNMYTVALSRSMSSDFARRWQKPGDEKITNVPSMANNSDDSSRDRFYSGSPAIVGKGDHIRLQDISFSYTFSGVNGNPFPIKQLRVYSYLSNVGLLWKANDFGLDPDVIPGDNSRFAYPAALSFSFGIKGDF